MIIISFFFYVKINIQTDITLRPILDHINHIYMINILVNYILLLDLFLLRYLFLNIFK